MPDSSSNGWGANGRSSILRFRNVRVLDATGEYPYTGEVLIQGNRIKQVIRANAAATAAACRITAAGRP